MHKGTVQALSSGAGLGSEFIVRLPITEASDGSPATGDPRRKDQPLLRHRVLVADDNKDSANSLSILLGMLGHEVRTVHDGLAAVEAAREFHPDLILLDIGMPRLNGYEACRRIRKLNTPTTPVIVACTGWGQDDDRQQSEDAGFNLHLVKPVDPAALEYLLAELSMSRE
jgi:CheY-like chemotaxis protein